MNDDVARAHRALLAAYFATPGAPREHSTGGPLVAPSSGDSIRLPDQSQIMTEWRQLLVAAVSLGLPDFTNETFTGCGRRIANDIARLLINEHHASKNATDATPRPTFRRTVTRGIRQLFSANPSDESLAGDLKNLAHELSGINADDLHQLRRIFTRYDQQLERLSELYGCDELPGGSLFTHVINGFRLRQAEVLGIALDLVGGATSLASATINTPTSERRAAGQRLRTARERFADLGFSDFAVEPGEPELHRQVADDINALTQAAHLLPRAVLRREALLAVVVNLQPTAVARMSFDELVAQLPEAQTAQRAQQYAEQYRQTHLWRAEAGGFRQLFGPLTPGNLTGSAVIDAALSGVRRFDDLAGARYAFGRPLATATKPPHVYGFAEQSRFGGAKQGAFGGAKQGALSGATELVEQIREWVAEASAFRARGLLGPMYNPAVNLARQCTYRSSLEFV